MLKIKTPLIIAHRGASGYQRENTLNAFALAYEQGASWIECDVQLTQDHETVIFHDHSLQRLYGIKENLNDFTVQRLQEIDKNIITLKKLLNWLKDKNLAVNLELKPTSGLEEKLVTQVLAHRATALKVEQ